MATPNVDKTPEEIEAFLALKPIDFTASKSGQSYKTNLLIFDKNFSNLKVYLNNCVGFLKYFYSLVDVSSLVSTVLSLISSGKVEVLVDATKAIGGFSLVTVGNDIYKCTRTDNYTVNITQTTNDEWNVDRLMVQVKNIDGTFVYPTITTKDNQLTINFADGILVNYKVFLI